MHAVDPDPEQPSLGPEAAQGVGHEGLADDVEDHVDAGRAGELERRLGVSLRRGNSNFADAREAAEEVHAHEADHLETLQVAALPGEPAHALLDRASYLLKQDKLTFPETMAELKHDRDMLL